MLRPLVIAAACTASAALSLRTGQAEAVKPPTPPYALGQAAPVPFKTLPESIVSRVQRVVDKERHRFGVPGLSVAVYQHGRLCLTTTSGLSDVENNVPMRTTTPLRLASISKALTSLLLGKLVDRGVIDWETKAAELLDDKVWPREGGKEEVTARMLASHRAGVRHYRDTAEFESVAHYDSVADAMSIFKDDDLLHAPGTAFVYTTFGYTVLSAMLEEAAARGDAGKTRKSFARLMRSEVFAPLQGFVHELFPDKQRSLVVDRCRYYVRKANCKGNDRLLNAPHVDLSNKLAGGGFVGTARGVASVGAHLIDALHGRDNTLLRQATVQHLFTPANGTDTGYALGWDIKRDVVLGRTIGHSGGSVGASSHLLMVPDSGISVAILANLQGVRLYETAVEVARTVQLDG